VPTLERVESAGPPAQLMDVFGEEGFSRPALTMQNHGCRRGAKACAREIASIIEGARAMGSFDDAANGDRQQVSVVMQVESCVDPTMLEA